MPEERSADVPGPGRRITAWQGSSSHRYARILLLIVLSFATGIAFGDTPWGSFLFILLLAITLLLALRTSEAGRRAKQVTFLILVPAVVVTGLSALFGEGRVNDGVTGLIGASLMFIAVGAIGREVIKHPDVTGQTVMGALCVYLLIGLFFAYLEQFMGVVGSGPFFVDHGDGSPSDYIYFSYVTLTTVGFGDLVANGSVGRATAVVEAIIGQLYLVTVVGFTVGNFAGRRREMRREESSGSD
jgi:hypothetical protein